MALREVALRYRVDGETGRMEGNTNAEITVDDDYWPPQNEREEDIGSTLSHPNYLHTLFVNAQARERIHESATLPLLVYLGSIGDLTTDWGYGDRLIYTVMKEEIKQVCKSMVDFVSYMHSKGLAFEDKLKLGVDNFRICDGILKFWKVSFRRASSITAKRRDYNLIGGVIESGILHGFRGTTGFPDFFTDFITRLKNFRENEADLLPNHIAVLSPARRLVFIQNMKNMMPYFTKAVVSDALWHLGNKSGWIDRLQYNPANPVCFWPIVFDLKAAHCKAPSLQNVVPGSPGFIAHLRTRFIDGGGVMPIIRSWEDQVDINRSLITLCRNLATHMIEEVSQLSVENVASMILNSFGEEIVEFQRLLSERGLLKECMGV